MNSSYAALIGRIQETLADLERVVNRTLFLMEKAQKTGDDGFLDGVALNLHGFYAGVERIFKDIAHTMDGSLPEGSDWHQNLLLQMTAEIPSIRPPVLSKPTKDMLDDYRGFRHVIRNIYTFNIKPTRLLELTNSLMICFKSFSNDLTVFIAFLENN